MAGTRRGTPKATDREATPALAETDPANPDVPALERKKLELEDELKHVEQQIYDLETKYLEGSSTMGNAIRGFHGFLGGASSSSTAARAAGLREEDRIFSSSSISGAPPAKGW